MTFYLGTHQPQWLGRTTVPLFVSRRRLADRKALPRATCNWALDSGGFTELEKFGGWSIGPKEYAAEVRRYRDQVGRMQWASPQDWMCEPTILEKTGLTVAEHQRRTLVNYLQLRELAPDVPWVPVLQGWEPADYLHHAESYLRVGVDLEGLPIVGLGSVCRRQHMKEAGEIVSRLQPLRLHGFGFKLTGIRAVGALLASSDSMSWSVHARYRPPMYPECTHINCANCMRWALEWRGQVVDCAPPPALVQLAFKLT